MRAFVTRDFNDFGTTKSFAAGTIVDMEKPTFVNYEAAGLVRSLSEDEEKDATEKAAAEQAKQPAPAAEKATAEQSAPSTAAEGDNA